MTQTREGAIKLAARHYGLSVEEYTDRVKLCSYCNKCKSWKPVEMFSVDKSRTNGLHKNCTECRRINGGVRGKPFPKGGVSIFKGRKHSDRSRMLMSQKRKGALNHRWKGGRVSFIQQIRNLGKFKEWRKTIYYRDKFTCQDCKTVKRGNNIILDADHIYPLSKILDDHNITTIEQAIACEALWDTSNGRTLCRPCHEETDTYGVNLIRNGTAK